jgi:hypothetical protein
LVVAASGVLLLADKDAGGAELRPLVGSAPDMPVHRVLTFPRD